MAKDAHDREDLLRDASAYTQRIELQLPELSHEVFCGFRDGQAFSLYWGQDAVFQFNHDSELRRGFWGDRMVACYKRELHWLVRKSDDPSSERVRLSRIAFTDDEHHDFLRELDQCCRVLESTLQSEVYGLVGRFPEEEDVQELVQTWLGQLPTPWKLAIHPGVGRPKQ